MNWFRHLMAWTTAVVLLLGCTDQHTPTDLASTASVPRAPVLSQGIGDTRLDVLATFRVKPEITIAWAKKWIGPEGGRLDFQGFTIEVPAGAVSRVTQFSINLPVDPKGSERVVAEFGPHNTQFAQPVTIGFPLAGTSIQGSSTATVVWWDGEGWVDVGGAASADGSQLFTTTDHFSEYGTTDVSWSGGVIASGG